jgi:hypothetical protein
VSPARPAKLIGLSRGRHSRRSTRCGFVHFRAVTPVLRSELQHRPMEIGGDGQRAFVRLVRPLPRRRPSQILPQTLEERVPDLSLGRLRPVLDLGQKLRLDPDAPVLVLQHGEIGGAVGGRYHDLAVDGGGRGLDVPRVVADFFEAMRPIVTAPGEDPDRLVGQADLDPVAVELDFVNPSGPDGTFSIEDAKAGSTKPGRGALTPISAVFLR